jgi:hypothetical protein
MLISARFGSAVLQVLLPAPPSLTETSALFGTISIYTFVDKMYHCAGTNCDRSVIHATMMKTATFLVLLFFSFTATAELYSFELGDFVNPKISSPGRETFRHRLLQDGAVRGFEGDRLVCNHAFEVQAGTGDMITVQFDAILIMRRVRKLLDQSPLSSSFSHTERRADSFTTETDFEDSIEIQSRVTQASIRPVLVGSKNVILIDEWKRF